MLCFVYVLNFLDRQLLVRAVLGPYGEVPFGPASPLLWIRHGAPAARPQDRAAAQRMGLATRLPKIRPRRRRERA